MLLILQLPHWCCGGESVSCIRGLRFEPGCGWKSHPQVMVTKTKSFKCHTITEMLKWHTSNIAIHHPTNIKVIFRIHILTINQSFTLHNLNTNFDIYMQGYIDFYIYFTAGNVIATVYQFAIFYVYC